MIRAIVKKCALLIVAVWASAASAQVAPVPENRFKYAITVPALSTTTAVGSAAITIPQASRIYLGGTAYIYSANGTDVYSGSGFKSSGALSILGTSAALSISGVTLGTCNSSQEGTIKRQSGTGGVNGGSETRFCVCVSNGAASPTYSWRNMISGTAGNATTCNP